MNSQPGELDQPALCGAIVHWPARPSLVQGWRRCRRCERQAVYLGSDLTSWGWLTASGGANHAVEKFQNEP